MTRILMFPIPNDAIQMQWSPNGRQLAVTMDNGRFFIYDRDKQARIPWTIFKEEDSPPGLADDISYVAWSPNGSLLALGGQGTLSIIHPLTGTICHRMVIPGGRSDVTSLSWSPDGKYLAIGTKSRCYLFRLLADATPQLQTWSDGHCGYKHANQKAIGWMRVSSEGNQPKALLALAHCNTFTIVDPQGGEVHCNEDQDLTKQASVFYKQRIACVDAKQTYVNVYTCDRTMTIYKQKVYQPEEKWLAIHKHNRFWKNNIDYGASLISWSPNGRYIATCFADTPQRIYVWEASTGATIQVFEGSENTSPHALAWGATNVLAWGGTRYIHIYQF